MKALICLITIIITNWFLSKASSKHGYIQLYIGQYPIWVRQLLTGKWSLYEREVEEQEYVGAGPKGLLRATVKTKRYYLSTAQGLKELTHSNYEKLFLELTPEDPKYRAAQKQIGLTYDQIPALVKQYNDWTAVGQYSSR